MPTVVQTSVSVAIRSLMYSMCINWRVPGLKIQVWVPPIACESLLHPIRVILPHTAILQTSFLRLNQPPYSHLECFREQLPSWLLDPTYVMNFSFGLQLHSPLSPALSPCSWWGNQLASKPPFDLSNFCWGPPSGLATTRRAHTPRESSRELAPHSQPLPAEKY